MKKFQKYDPEDIESLLLNKEFSELYDEERAFVLRHISSEPEYNRLRKTLLNVKGTVSDDNDLLPSDHIKSNLLDAVRQNAPARGFGLNGISLFLRELVTRPAFRYSAVGLAVLVIAFFIVRDRFAEKNNEIAVTEEPVKKNIDTNEKQAPQEPVNNVPAQPSPSDEPQVADKNTYSPNEKKNSIDPQPSPAVASRSLAQDSELDDFLYEVM